MEKCKGIFSDKDLDIAKSGGKNFLRILYQDRIGALVHDKSMRESELGSMMARTIITNKKAINEEIKVNKTKINCLKEI